jgi:histidinol-phosphate aminotransferase
VEAFLEKGPPEVVVVMDEAYFEYASGVADYPDSLKYHDGSRRMITTRTFSKIHGLAGLRVGYAVAAPELISPMDKVREVFNVNRVAQEAATAALGDHEHIRLSQETAEAGVAWLADELGARGIKHWPSFTNFVFVEFDRPAREVYEALLPHGVIIRPLPQGYARITVGLPEENKRLMAGLDKVLSP